MARIAELWVYHGESVPRTVKLKSARVTNTGFELDRAFLRGRYQRQHGLEGRSDLSTQRALSPVLATIDVAVTS